MASIGTKATGPKCAKHGVSREKIEALFYEPSFQFRPDAAHSGAEQRWVGIGVGPISERWLLTIFTLRKLAGRQAIRPISARFMHNKEINNYFGSNPF